MAGSKTAGETWKLLAKGGNDRSGGVFTWAGSGEVGGTVLLYCPLFSPGECTGARLSHPFSPGGREGGIHLQLLRYCIVSFC